MNLKIKNTTGITLDGSKLSGNTFPVKDWIKTYLGGKWDNNSRSWIVDTNKLEEMIAKGANIYVDSSQPQQTNTRRANTRRDNGWCNRCHSYCYGDCTAN